MTTRTYTTSKRSIRRSRRVARSQDNVLGGGVAMNNNLFASAV